MEKNKAIWFPYSPSVIFLSISLQHNVIYKPSLIVYAQ